MLSLIFLTLIFTIFVLFFIPGHNKKLLGTLGLGSSGLVLIFSVYLFINFENNSCFFQNVVLYNFGSLLLNFDFIFGFDGISIYFFFVCCLSWMNFILRSI